MRIDRTEQFLDLLWGKRKGYAELRFMKDATVTPVFFRWPYDCLYLLDEVEKFTGDDDIFMGVLLRTEKKGDAAHCERETEWLWADVDKKKGITFSRILKTLMVDPQIVVDSGHGWHLYWHLKKPVPTLVATGAMKVIADVLGGDAVGDPARIMRVPGTYNLKGGDSVPVRLLRLDPVTRYSFSDFDLPEVEGRSYDRAEYTAGESWELSGEDAPKFSEGDRNHSLTRLAGAMLIKGMTDEEMLLALRAENEVRCSPPLPDKEVQSIVKSVRRYR